MAEDHYKARPLSRDQIRRYAKSIRKVLGLENAEYIDIIGLVENVLPRLFSGSTLSVEIIEKEKMGNNQGLTFPETGKMLIREDVYEGACRGKGRDRLTVAHEFGHYLLHAGVGLARAEGDVPTYCDPEWQATAFAAEFLMDHDVIASMTVDEIMEKCGVIRTAASYQKSK